MNPGFVFQPRICQRMILPAVFVGKEELQISGLPWDFFSSLFHIHQILFVFIGSGQKHNSLESAPKGGKKQG